MFQHKLSFCLFAIAAACGPNSNGGNEDAGNGAVALTLSPPSATLEVVDGAAASQAFTATVEYTDGTTEDVSASATFSVGNFRLGGFQGPLFSTSGAAGGQTTVTAQFDGLSAQAELTVRVRDVLVLEPAPVNAPDLFDSAADDPSLAPTLVYPADATMVPPNLGDFDVHWTDSAGVDLFEVTLASEFVELSTYVVGTPNAGSWIAVAPEQWAVAAASDRASGLSIQVRGMSANNPGVAGTSAAVTTVIAGQEIQGGIYYWASQAVDGPGGIYRHDMGAVGEPAERFYTTDESPNGRCVACHALSRDGTKMALTFDGGNGASTILDVATRTPILPLDPTFAWNFAAFEPDADRLLTVSYGALTLRSTIDGSVIADVPTSGYATHPDFRPQGDAIVYAVAGAPGQDWHFTGGAIVTQPYDPDTQTFGAPTVLVENDGSGNNYYPSWSPDGEWILFNRSTEDAYDDGSAELYAVKADGSAPPIQLVLPNVGAGLTNSWARWAPFAQDHDSGGQSERFYWFTFSSKRNFGVRLVNASRPQVWMAPFFPDRALAGQPASAPAFRLPAQDITGSNHIAQWTEEVIDIE